MKNTTTLRSFACHYRPYGCDCYEAQILDSSLPHNKDTVWTGGRYDLYQDALDEAEEEIVRRTK